MSKDSSSAHIKRGMLAAGSSILGHYGHDMRRSTLLNETGNVEIYRVSEETRKKVQAETRRIEQQRIKNNQRSRANFYQTENEKIKQKEGNYRSMVHRWERKLAESPYNVNQLELEEKRQIHLEEWENEKKIRAERNNLVFSFNGKAPVGIVDAERMKAFGAGAKLALSLRQTLRDKETIQTEHQLLNHMLLQEVAAIKKSFPLISIPDTLFKEEMEADHFTFPESVSSKSMSMTSGNSVLKMMKPKKENKFSKGKQPPPQPDPHLGDNESSTFTGPLSYTAPTTKIQELEQDLDCMSFTNL